MRKMKTMDGNTAAAYISYAFTEVAGIYPITPSSTMAEVVDEWAENGLKNIFGETVNLIEMQSEAGAAGTVHGSLKTGVLTTTYTASQGLLLMIPNMFKIAGELLPTVFHVAARAVSTNALSIFGDHSDVMAARQTGFCMLAESSVQEVMDLSAVAHLASIEGSLPFMNFFDGFRTSHELQKIEALDYDELKEMVNWEALERFRKRGMNPNHPTVSGTAQNPDIHFQQRETVNSYYDEMPKIVQKYMQKINNLRGTNYDLMNYYGDPEATEVIISMGSASPTIQQTVDYLNSQGRKVGHIDVHLYRPFPAENLLEKLPKKVERVAVLDRTKEPGSDGEPLLLDVQSVLYRHENRPIIIGGRYGIASKDVTPNHIVSVFDHLLLPVNELKQRFTIGINDDVTYLSLPMTEMLDLTKDTTFQAKFWGFGSDGTVGANKQAIKIIGNNTDKYAQAYFAYDSKKSGGLTVSHLRFGDDPILSTYNVECPDFVGCHNAAYLHKYDLVKGLRDGGTFLLNTVWDVERVKTHLPKSLKRYLAEHSINFYIINAMEIAQRLGLGRRINTVMSAAFFEVTDIMDRSTFLPFLKDEVKAAYGKKSMAIVEKNWEAIDATFAALTKVDLPEEWKTLENPVAAAEISNKPAYVRNILEPVNRQEGNQLSVNDLIQNGMLGGEMAMGTAAYEKRGIALEVPEWIPENCTMCNECAFICPHAAIRPFLADEAEMEETPEGFITRTMKGPDNLEYRIQVSLEDCTGCGLCVEMCPAKDKALVMKSYEEQKEQALNWAFAMTLRQKANPIKKFSIKGSQFEQPLIEFSGACAGCGETPYVKLLTQLYGDRMMIANTTGCSSIWGASAPATPYTVNAEGKGPAWSNSLFEDNAEYGLGMYIANETKRKRLAVLLQKAVDNGYGSETTQAQMQDWLDHAAEGEGTQQRAAKLAQALREDRDDRVKEILNHEEMFAKPSQWMLGGDGWAYDIGYSGIDHVLATGADVNIFVMDNEVYANTGGQMSKATPTSAIAKFAAGGKKTKKKDLGLMAMAYRDVYVASISIEANPAQALKAITEAESYPGPSLIIGYTPCINHGQRGGMSQSIKVAKDAVESGYWPLYRHDPRLRAKGKEPMRVDFKKADFSKMEDFLRSQVRFSALRNIKQDEIEVEQMLHQTVTDMEERSESYTQLLKK
ncbi:pyruvate:ferredoxin (flavodoxin) oxidoreductase [Enterococcus sp. BWB1-3]|uniref:pyruvate:ferredoxin (flavodoxin) oxidoreductase n=1 Tax=unclassified Enterococcus TaxID=2608891 RepID=UPI0019251649|nr:MULTISPECIES: pyruvate:ferredoxin (flavodoxin) oxidoreductase [unclassified Enterococcus]MBL1229051.1 pyruvate:ferredoxin (flavodoxin) oxidoreductase [Enterococcus sp. BWB1-3]MCB5955452.1 pyruvate:ferredoxin (flavodoxin) oxidoreductase [Enterococcus sp. CWB-B31]